MGSGNSKQLQQNFDSLQIEINSYQKENKNYKNQIQTLEKDNKVCKQTKIEMDTKLDNLNNTNNQCQIEKKVCFRDKTLLDNTIIEKVEELKVCRTKSMDLNAKFNNLEEQQKKLKNDMNQKSNNLQIANSNYMSCQKTNAELMKKNAELMQQTITTEAKCSNSSLNDKVIELSNELGKVKNACAADKNKFDLDMSVKISQIAGLKNDIENVKESSSSLDTSKQTKISELETIINDKDKKINEFEKTIENNISKISELQTNIDSLNTEKITNSSRIGELETNIGSLNTEINNKNNTINSNRTTIESKEQTITDKNKQIEKVTGLKNIFQRMIETNEIKAVHGLAPTSIRTSVSGHNITKETSLQNCIVRAKYTNNAVAYIYSTSKHPNAEDRNKCDILSRHDRYKGGNQPSPSGDRYHITGCISKNADGKIKDITKEHCG